jgi:hypothetical protein
VSSTDSWWLKIKRAEKHLADLENEIAVYAARRPYEARRVIQAKSNPNHYRFDLHITEPPDPCLAIIIGDILHNARSALDHITVGIAPKNRKSKAGFPVLAKDLWLKNGRCFVYRERRDVDARRSYNSKVKGIVPGARAIIEAAQPYNRGGTANRQPLAFLNALENADKHRELLVIAAGAGSALVSARIRGGQVDYSAPPPDPPGFFKDGAVVAEYDFLHAEAPPIAESEMKVEFSGTLTIAIRVGEKDGYALALPVLREMLTDVQQVLRDLGPYVR